LRSSVLGANDGLVSILALVAGVAGATTSNGLVLLAGLAGLVAGAASMAASNYVAVQAEQQAYRAKVEGERAGLEAARDLKLRGLEASLVAKGSTEAEAGAMVQRLAKDDAKLLGAILFEHHGIAEAVFARPGRLAAYTGVAFAVAGVLPVLPFVFLLGQPGTFVGLVLSVLAGAVGLFILGVLKTVVTYGPALRSGAEMLAIGLGAAGATYAIGYLVGLQGIAG
jgi:VIT1/CCC1 family predicted Fe2+/Mn2+ transporter